ncbi:periplasmic chaperone for outer membrane proteins Skp [Pseudooceanicola antarcticus]|uniref:Periplasmic chaperone for outer membrane proteins Skp n=1 Tax=Pseudooceanicola antarcticus TaxID=1247613 RepID=A0A285IWM6_9RHOB|nr:OmpH family outer membrane protein [Pseudooceanicola antarcticus]SNY52223.1 periplasmic chaperone for outer membrane proteins Skp [Pseudooceanicola antarcticus]
MPGLRRRFLTSLAASVLSAALAGNALAQETDIVIPRSPVLVVDSERMFSDSAFGQQLAARVEAQAAAIAAENRRIEAELAKEEQALTERRPTMTPDEFRTMANTFDEKVTRIRRERDEAAADLSQSSEALRRRFLLAVEPVLYSIMQEAGSAVILERRTVFVTREVVDITDEAINRIDAQLLKSEATPENAPEAAPETAPTETAPVLEAPVEGDGGTAPESPAEAPANP